MRNGLALGRYERIAAVLLVTGTTLAGCGYALVGKGVTTDPSMSTVVMGIHSLVQVTEAEPRWHYVMAVTILALIPPVIVVVAMQRLFVKGLDEQEK